MSMIQAIKQFFGGGGANPRKRPYRKLRDFSRVEVARDYSLILNEEDYFQSKGYYRGLRGARKLHRLMQERRRLEAERAKAEASPAQASERAN